MFLKKVIWLGDSKAKVSEFPQAVRENLGFQMYRLQLGKLPTHSRPMQSIGKGVFELKEHDESGWYRIIYATHVRDIVYVLHSFKKQSAKTARNDIQMALKRLKSLKEHK